MRTVYHRTHRKNALYDAGLVDSKGANLLLDSGYTPPGPTNIAAFLQDGRKRLDFIRHIIPKHQATGIARREDVSAHMIGNYGDFSTVKLYVNGVEVQRNVVASVNGILVSREVAAEQLGEDLDGFTRIRVVGTEAVAGEQEERWHFTVVAKLPLVGLAAAQVTIRPLQVGLATAQIGIRQLLTGLATAAVRHRLIDQLIGRAAGRIFVGEYQLWFDSGPALNVAEADLQADGAVTMEVQGYRVNTDDSITVEISGPNVHTHASITVGIAEVTLTFDSGVSVNLAALDEKALASITNELWGEQTGDPSGRLVIRVSSLPAAIKAALEDQGIKFT